METTKKEPRTSKDQSTSAMGTMQGARRATGIVPMAGAHWGLQTGFELEEHPRHPRGGRPIGSGLGCQDPGPHALGYPRVELRTTF